MPYVTALPLLQERASAEASDGASPHRSTQSGQCTVQPDRARESVPVLAGTRHPQPAQSAGYLLERGLFRVFILVYGLWFRISRRQASAQQWDRSARAHAVRLGSRPASPAPHARCLAEWGGARQRRLASRSGRRVGLRLGLGLGLFVFAWFVFWFTDCLGLSATPTEDFRESCEKFAKGVWFVAEKPD